MTTECSQVVGQICERMRAVNAELAACRAENDRYRAALVAIVDFEKQHLRRFSDAEQIALNALSIRRTESGQLSDDSGPIARCGNCDWTGDVHRADGEWIGACHCQNDSAPIAEAGK